MDNNEAENNLISDEQNNNTLETPKELYTDLGNTKVEEIQEEMDTGPINDIESDSEPIGKKEMNTFLTNLNSYWVEIMASLGLFLFILLYEIIGFLILLTLNGLFDSRGITIVGDAISAITDDIGIKWFVLIIIFQNVSIGFFCLTTFSDIFRETKDIKRFFIHNGIKVIAFYLLSIIILGAVIDDGIKDFIQKNIEEKSDKYKPEDKQKLIDLFNNTADSVLILVGNYLAIFNIFYDKFILGILYIFLFTTPCNIQGFKKYIFRACSIFPIAFIIVSLVLRALNTTKHIKINIYVSPLLLASKITIYGFFIITLVIIKFKSLKYNVYDEEKYISPKVFKKIATKIYLIFGVFELLFGFFKASWINIGIGGKYLLILCTPIIILYDYKKESKLTIKCFLNEDFSNCFRIIFNVIGYLVIAGFGLVLYILLRIFIDKHLQPLLDFISQNIELFLTVIARIT